jgi:preprotein translocase subunit SecE
VATEPKPNFIQRIGQGIQRMIQETIGELRKVSWPTRSEAFNLTRIVLLVIGVMALFLGVLDFLYSQFFRLLLGL